MKLGAALIVCELFQVGAGCSDIPQLKFQNNCDSEILLQDWEITIAAGEEATIDSERPSAQRINWKYSDGRSEQSDFIELNGDWTGPGSQLCGHPSYSTYNGYNMASKYEALNPDDWSPACRDMGAAMTYSVDECPTQAGNGYLCEGSNECDSDSARYMESCSMAINSDGSWTPQNDGGFGQNYVNFWCDEAHGFSAPQFLTGGPVGTLMDCIENSISFVLKVTTCGISSSDSHVLKAARNGTHAFV